MISSLDRAQLVLELRPKTPVTSSTDLITIQRVTSVAIDSSRYQAVASVAASVAAVVSAGASFSHGFLLVDFAADVPWPANTVSGICFMPGIGFPLCIKSTISW